MRFGGVILVVIFRSVVCSMLDVWWCVLRLLLVSGMLCVVWCYVSLSVLVSSVVWLSLSVYVVVLI